MNQLFECVVKLLEQDKSKIINLQQQIVGLRKKAKTGPPAERNRTMQQLAYTQRALTRERNKLANSSLIGNAYPISDK